MTSRENTTHVFRFHRSFYSLSRFTTHFSKNSICFCVLSWKSWLASINSGFYLYLHLPCVALDSPWLFLILPPLLLISQRLVALLNQSKRLFRIIVIIDLRLYLKLFDLIQTIFFKRNHKLMTRFSFFVLESSHDSLRNKTSYNHSILHGVLQYTASYTL